MSSACLQVKRWGLRTRCTFQKSTEWSFKSSPNTLSFKKVFPAELIWNLQTVTWLVCPTQIFRQTKEDSLDHCVSSAEWWMPLTPKTQDTGALKAPRHWSLPCTCWYMLRYLQSGVQLNTSSNAFDFTVNSALAISSTRWVMFQLRDQQWWAVDISAKFGTGEGWGWLLWFTALFEIILSSDTNTNREHYFKLQILVLWYVFLYWICWFVLLSLVLKESILDYIIGTWN